MKLFVVRHKSGDITPDSLASDQATCIMRFMSCEMLRKYIDLGWNEARNDGYEVVPAYVGPLNGLDDVVNFLAMTKPGGKVTITRVKDGLQVVNSVENDPAPTGLSKLFQPLQDSLTEAYLYRRGRTA